MIVAVTRFKGGVGKTTTAVHLACFLAERGLTLLVDGDPNRSATGWHRRGGLPVTVVDERVAARYAREHAHMVIDTQARPTEEHLRALAQGVDLLVLPTTPNALALEALRGAEARFRVLLTMVPPPPSRDGEEARALLGAEGVPLFAGWVRRAAAFPKAALLGVPVYRVPDPRARLAWGDYARVGKSS
jgi:chromosome partitioning protein